MAEAIHTSENTTELNSKFKKKRKEEAKSPGNHFPLYQEVGQQSNCCVVEVIRVNNGNLWDKGNPVKFKPPGY